MVDGYSLLNARVGFRVADGWTLSVWSRNLLNKDYFELLTAAPGNTGLYVGQPGDPRTVGVTLRMTFKSKYGQLHERSSCLCACHAQPVDSTLVVITLVAAIVNGGLGYGFSSITVPLALLFLSNRVLNPALVLIEVALNAYVLWVNRDALGVVWRRVAADRRRAGAGRDRRHADRVARQPGVAEALDLPRAAAADPAPGGRVTGGRSGRSARSACRSASGSACCIR